MFKHTVPQHLVDAASPTNRVLSELTERANTALQQRMSKFREHWRDMGKASVLGFSDLLLQTQAADTVAALALDYPDLLEKNLSDTTQLTPEQMLWVTGGVRWAASREIVRCVDQDGNVPLHPAIIVGGKDPFVRAVYLVGEQQLEQHANDLALVKQAMLGILMMTRLWQVRLIAQQYLSHSFNLLSTVITELEAVCEANNSTLLTELKSEFQPKIPQDVTPEIALLMERYQWLHYLQQYMIDDLIKQNGDPTTSNRLAQIAIIVAIAEAKLRQHGKMVAHDAQQLATVLGYDQQTRQWPAVYQQYLSYADSVLMPDDQVQRDEIAELRALLRPDALQPHSQTVHVATEPIRRQLAEIIAYFVKVAASYDAEFLRFKTKFQPASGISAAISAADSVAQLAQLKQRVADSQEANIALLAELTELAELLRVEEQALNDNGCDQPCFEQPRQDISMLNDKIERLGETIDANNLQLEQQLVEIEAKRKLCVLLEKHEQCAKQFAKFAAQATAGLARIGAKETAQNLPPDPEQGIMVLSDLRSELDREQKNQFPLEFGSHLSCTRWDTLIAARGCSDDFVALRDRVPDLFDQFAGRCQLVSDSYRSSIYQLEPRRFSDEYGLIDSVREPLYTQVATTKLATLHQFEADVEQAATVNVLAATVLTHQASAQRSVLPDVRLREVDTQVIIARIVEKVIFPFTVRDRRDLRNAVKDRWTYLVGNRLNNIMLQHRQAVVGLTSPVLDVVFSDKPVAKADVKHQVADLQHRLSLEITACDSEPVTERSRVMLAESKPVLENLVSQLSLFSDQLDGDEVDYSKYQLLPEIAVVIAVSEYKNLMDHVQRADRATLDTIDVQARVAKLEHLLADRAVMARFAERIDGLYPQYSSEIEWLVLVDHSTRWSELNHSLTVNANAYVVHRADQYVLSDVKRHNQSYSQLNTKFKPADFSPAIREATTDKALNKLKSPIAKANRSNQALLSELAALRALVKRQYQVLNRHHGDRDTYPKTWQLLDSLVEKIDSLQERINENNRLLKRQLADIDAKKRLRKSLGKQQAIADEFARYTSQAALSLNELHVSRSIRDSLALPPEQALQALTSIEAGLATERARAFPLAYGDGTVCTRAAAASKLRAAIKTFEDNQEQLSVHFGRQAKVVSDSLALSAATLDRQQFAEIADFRSGIYQTVSEQCVKTVREFFVAINEADSIRTLAVDVLTTEEHVLANALPDGELTQADIDSINGLTAKALGVPGDITSSDVLADALQAAWQPRIRDRLRDLTEQNRAAVIELAPTLAGVAFNDDRSSSRAVRRRVDRLLAAIEADILACDGGPFTNESQGLLGDARDQLVGLRSQLYLFSHQLDGKPVNLNNHQLLPEVAVEFAVARYRQLMDRLRDGGLGGLDRLDLSSEIASLKNLLADKVVVDEFVRRVDALHPGYTDQLAWQPLVQHKDNWEDLKVCLEDNVGLYHQFCRAQRITAISQCMQLYLDLLDRIPLSMDSVSLVDVHDRLLEAGLVCSQQLSVLVRDDSEYDHAAKLAAVKMTQVTGRTRQYPIINSSQTLNEWLAAQTSVIVSARAVQQIAPLTTQLITARDDVRSSSTLSRLAQAYSQATARVSDLQPHLPETEHLVHAAKRQHVAAAVAIDEQARITRIATELPDLLREEARSSVARIKQPYADEAGMARQFASTAHAVAEQLDSTPVQAVGGLLRQLDPYIDGRYRCRVNCRKRHAELVEMQQVYTSQLSDLGSQNGFADLITEFVARQRDLEQLPIELIKKQMAYFVKRFEERLQRLNAIVEARELLAKQHYEIPIILLNLIPGLVMPVRTALLMHLDEFFKEVPQWRSLTQHIDNPNALKAAIQANTHLLYLQKMRMAADQYQPLLFSKQLDGKFATTKVLPSDRPILQIYMPDLPKPKINSELTLCTQAGFKINYKYTDNGLVSILLQSKDKVSGDMETARSFEERCMLAMGEMLLHVIVTGASIYLVKGNQSEVAFAEVFAGLFVRHLQMNQQDYRANVEGTAFYQPRMEITEYNRPTEQHYARAQQLLARLVEHWRVEAQVANDVHYQRDPLRVLRELPGTRGHILVQLQNNLIAMDCKRQLNRLEQRSPTSCHQAANLNKLADPVTPALRMLT